MLTWKWDEKCGEIKTKLGTYNMYKCNAFMMALAEWKDKESGDDMYNLYCFFADKEHMKNMLGLSKKFQGDNLCKDWESVTLYKNMWNKKDFKDMVEGLTTSFENLELNIKTIKEKE